MEVEMFQNETCKTVKKASACRILNVGKFISYIFFKQVEVISLQTLR